LAKRRKKNKKPAPPGPTGIATTGVPSLDTPRRPDLAPGAVPLLLLLLAVLASLTLGFVWNEDLWWYLASGDTVLDQGFPDHDLFLYTSGDSTRWPSHSWLWSVLLVLCQRLAGLWGVVLLGAAVAAATVVLVYTAAKVDRLGVVNTLFTGLILVSAAERLSLKAELASWLLLVLFFYLLDRDRPFTPRTLLLLAALQWLWSNLHAGYPLGLAIALAYSVGGFVQDRWQRRKGGGLGIPPPPLWTVPALFLATLLTPEVEERLRIFYAGADITASRLAGSGLTVAIDELQGTFAVEDPRFATLYLVALAAGLLAWWGSPKGPRRLARLFLLLGMAVLAYTAIRHVTALVLSAALVGITCLGERAAARPKPAGRPGTPHLAAAGVLGALLLAATAGLWLLRTDFEAGQSRDSFYTVSPLAASPGAAEAIERRSLPGPIFNDLILGGQLTYALYPEHRFFIDNRAIRGRLNQEYVELSTSQEAWQAAQERYGFRTAVLSNLAVPNHIPLRSLLASDPAWHLVYLDPAAVVFTRRRGLSPEIYPEGGTGEVPFLTPEKGSGVLLRRIGGWFFRTDPAEMLHQYLSVLGRLKLNQEMEDLATRALEERPGDARLYRDRGSARMLLGLQVPGLEDLQEAVRLEPEDPWNHYTLALALRDSGRIADALEAAEQAQRMDPSNGRFEALRRRLAAVRGAVGRDQR
jgi:tetratricopeptide (TPR) repeat protein